MYHRRTPAGLSKVYQGVCLAAPMASRRLWKVIEPRSKAPAYEISHTTPGFCCRCLRQVLVRFGQYHIAGLRRLSGEKRPCRKDARIAKSDPEATFATG